MFLRPLLLLLLLTAGMAFAPAQRPPQLQPQGTVVYICNSKEAVAYHSSKNCKGLQKCTHEVLKVTQEEAVSTYNRRACKICY